jgi:hypothetical protein
MLSQEELKFNLPYPGWMRSLALANLIHFNQQ